MAENSKIEWTHHTFNPWRGCTKVSAGCKFCYAETLSERNPAILGVWGPKGSRPIAAESYWKLPEKWNREAEKEGVRKRVFCASLADVFEDSTTMPATAWLAVEKARERLFALIQATPDLDWLLLTKRPQNVMRYVPTRWAGFDDSKFPDNLWIGTSVEDQKTADERIPHLLRIPAKVRFLSCEPLLGPVNLTWSETSGWSPADQPGAAIWHSLSLYPAMSYDGEFTGGIEEIDDYQTEIHWVICGGESGRDARPMHPEWARSLRDQCQAAGVPFLFKQWGEFAPTGLRPLMANGSTNPGHQIIRVDGTRYQGPSQSAPKGAELMDRIGKKRAGRLLDGREWNEFPGGQS